MSRDSTETQSAPVKRSEQQRRTLTRQHDNALHLLVRQLAERRPAFLQDLAVDLDPCVKARDLDPRAITDAVQRLSARVSTIEDRTQGALPHQRVDPIGEEPEALRPERLRSFLEVALPEVQCLRRLVEELDSAGAALRRYFAEPADSSLVGMFQCLAALHEALPQAPVTSPLPPLQASHPQVIGLPTVSNSEPTASLLLEQQRFQGAEVRVVPPPPAPVPGHFPAKCSPPLRGRAPEKRSVPPQILRRQQPHLTASPALASSSLPKDPVRRGSAPMQIALPAAFAAPHAIDATPMAKPRGPSAP